MKKGFSIAGIVVSCIFIIIGFVVLGNADNLPSVFSGFGVYVGWFIILIAVQVLCAFGCRLGEAFEDEKTKTVKLSDKSENSVSADNNLPEL